MKSEMNRRDINRLLALSPLAALLGPGRLVSAKNAEVKSTLKIQLSGVPVDNQDKALKFYTDVLGFVKKRDIPLGEYRWLTVISPQGHDDVELLLEPTAFPPAATYQKALFDAGIPWTMFAVDDIEAEYERLQKLGVEFKSKPTLAGDVTIAVFKDTCGNWIQLYESAEEEE